MIFGIKWHKETSKGSHFAGTGTLNVLKKERKTFEF